MTEAIRVETSNHILNDKLKLAKILGLRHDHTDTRASSDKFPLILRPCHGQQRLFYGCLIKRHAFETWDFSCRLFWTKASVTQLGFWEVECLDNTFFGYYFAPKKTDLNRTDPIAPNSNMWACKKWRASYAVLPESLVETLKLVARRQSLPQKFTAETTGKDRLIDIHPGWNPAYSQHLVRGGTLDIHVGWSFDKPELSEAWTPIEYDSPYSEKPTCLQILT